MSHWLKRRRTRDTSGRKAPSERSATKTEDAARRVMIRYRAILTTDLAQHCQAPSRHRQLHRLAFACSLRQLPGDQRRETTALRTRRRSTLKGKYDVFCRRHVVREGWAKDFARSAVNSRKHVKRTSRKAVHNHTVLRASAGTTRSEGSPVICLMLVGSKSIVSQRMRHSFPDRSSCHMIVLSVYLRHGKSET